MSPTHESLPPEQQVVDICACGAPLYGVFNEAGERIGVTHAVQDEDDMHLPYFSQIRIDPK